MQVNKRRIIRSGVWCGVFWEISLTGLKHIEVWITSFSKMLIPKHKISTENVALSRNKSHHWNTQRSDNGLEDVRRRWEEKISMLCKVWTFVYFRACTRTWPKKLRKLESSLVQLSERRRGLSKTKRQFRANCTILLKNYFLKCW